MRFLVLLALLGLTGCATQAAPAAALAMVVMLAGACVPGRCAPLRGEELSMCRVAERNRLRPRWNEERNERRMLRELRQIRRNTQ